MRDFLNSASTETVGRKAALACWCMAMLLSVPAAADPSDEGAVSESADTQAVPEDASDSTTGSAQSEAAPELPPSAAESEAAPELPPGAAETEAAPEPPPSAAETEVAPEPPPSAAETEAAPEPPPSPAESYGIRYVERQLTMPQGMVRGTFDMTVGNVAGFSSIAFDFGAAVSPVDHLEIGFSRYRMGAFPSGSFTGAFGGRGLLPVIAEGSDLVPTSRTKGGAFGDIIAYVRGEVPMDDVANLALDIGFLIPTVSNFGMLLGVPLRFHGGKVAAIDTGLEVLFGDIGEPSGSVITVSVPVNLVFNVTDEGFLMLNAGFSAFDPGEDFTVTTFPLGVGVGYTVSTRRLMCDLFALFSWPGFGTIVKASDFFGESLRETENITEITTVTIGANFYSPVLFGKR